MMKFSDLMSVQYDTRTDKISVHELKKILPGTPIPVVRQFFSEHGRKSDFQRSYGQLDVSSLNWCIRSLEAEKIVSCEIFKGFVGWTKTVENRIAVFESKGWSCIDTRNDVVCHWRQYGSWREEPIFINGKLIGRSNCLRLVEGHSRIGVLRGLIRKGILKNTSQHKIWFGDLS